MKAYFYCRVAHDDSFSLEQQVAKLRRYAEQAGYTIVGVAAEHGSPRDMENDEKASSDCSANEKEQKLHGHNRPPGYPFKKTMALEYIELIIRIFASIVPDSPNGKAALACR